MEGNLSVEERIKKVIINKFTYLREEEVVPEASFIDDLGADSLDLVELIMALEEAFGKEISDEEAEKIQTVQDAIDYVTKNMAAV